MAVPLASAGDAVLDPVGLDPEVDPELVPDPDVLDPEPVVVTGAGVPVPVEPVVLLLARGLGVVSLGAALVDTALTVGVAVAIVGVGTAAGVVAAVSVAMGAAEVVVPTDADGTVATGLAEVLAAGAETALLVAGAADVAVAGAADVAVAGAAVTPPGLLAASVEDLDDPPLRLAAITTPAMAITPTTPTIKGQPPRRRGGPPARTAPPPAPAPAAVGRRGGWVPPLDGPEDPPERPLGPGRLGGGFLLAISPPPIGSLGGQATALELWYRPSQLPDG